MLQANAALFVQVRLCILTVYKPLGICICKERTLASFSHAIIFSVYVLLVGVGHSQSSTTERVFVFKLCLNVYVLRRILYTFSE